MGFLDKQTHSFCYLLQRLPVGCNCLFKRIENHLCIEDQTHRYITWKPIFKSIFWQLQPAKKKSSNFNFFASQFHHFSPDFIFLRKDNLHRSLCMIYFPLVFHVPSWSFLCFLVILVFSSDSCY